MCWVLGTLIPSEEWENGVIMRARPALLFLQCRGAMLSTDFQPHRTAQKPSRDLGRTGLPTSERRHCHEDLLPSINLSPTEEATSQSDICED